MGRDLLEQAEQLRTRALQETDPVMRNERAQFFTRHRVAELIAALPRLPSGSETIRVLDPGSGSGMLLAALVHRIGRERPGARVRVTAVELDERLLPFLHATAQRCREWAEASGISLEIEIRGGDFLTTATDLWQADTHGCFDLVITNPPYAKLPVNSAPRQALKSAGVDCPNMYAAFLAAGLLALTEGGQLVAITPRSFTNGPYFEQFRTFFLRSLSLDRIHVFESRSTVFSDAGVMQENLVLSGTRGGEPHPVCIAVSGGDRDEATEHRVHHDEIVHPDDPHRLVRIVVGQDRRANETMATLPHGLADLGVRVSTGKVVGFRARDNLRDSADSCVVPLIHPGNLHNGVVEWPRPRLRAQGFAVLGDRDRAMLAPPGTYVVVKRFSAKEERRRIVAAVWDRQIHGSSPVAFENHVNFLHHEGSGLDRDLAWGLSFWLNSSLVDTYFRTFSGSTQVNAADLRCLRYPPVSTLRRLGRNASPTVSDQDEVDRLVGRIVSS